MKIVLTPDWFLGPDVSIEIFSFLVLLAFFIYSIRSYKINKNKNALYLGIGFLIIALAEISTILTKFVLYYDTTFVQVVGQMVVTNHVVRSVDIFYNIGFFMYKLLTLVGLYIIYRIPLKRSAKRDVILGACFVLLSGFSSYLIFQIFHLTSIVLLELIIYNYSEIYKKNKSKNTCILITAFLILLLSHSIMLLHSRFLYVFAQFSQLISYLILLVLIIKITRTSNDKKKK